MTRPLEDIYVEQLEELLAPFSAPHTAAGPPAHSRSASTPSSEPTTATARPEVSESVVDDAKQLLSLLEVQIGSVADKSKQALLRTKAKEYDRLIKTLRRQLLTGLSGSSSSPAALSSVQSAEQGVEILRGARAELVTTIAVAEDTHTRLVEDTEKLQEIRRKAQQLNGDLKEGNTTLTRVYNREKVCCIQ